jgi:hypothetical protein
MKSVVTIAAAAIIAAGFALATEPAADASSAITAGKADRLDAAARLAQNPCARETWPHISAQCIRLADRFEEPRIATRVVTTEARPEAGVSVLVRQALDQTAQR